MVSQKFVCLHFDTARDSREKHGKTMPKLVLARAHTFSKKHTLHTSTADVPQGSNHKTHFIHGAQIWGSPHAGRKVIRLPCNQVPSLLAVNAYDASGTLSLYTFPALKAHTSPVMTLRPPPIRHKLIQLLFDL